MSADHQTTRRTVRVRVMVGIDRDGGWTAMGDSNYAPEYRPIVEADGYAWLEADVDVPEEDDVMEAFVVEDAP